MYTNKLDDKVNKCDNTYHITIKMKVVDIESSTYIDSSKKINDRDIKLEIKKEEINGTFYEKQTKSKKKKKIKKSSELKK